MNTTASKTFLFVINGTRGDLHPFLALAKSLVERGISVYFCTNDEYEEVASSMGLTFISTGSKEAYRNYYSRKPHLMPLEGQIIALNELALPAIERVLRLAIELVGDGANIQLVTPCESWTATAIADVFARPPIYVGLYPTMFSLACSPPYPRRELWHPLLLKLFLRLERCYARLFVYRKHYLPPLNLLRSRFGLGPINLSKCRSLNSNWLGVAFFPEWLEKNTKMWPLNIKFVGFPLFDPEYNFDRSVVERFVNDYGPPVIVTPGTGVADVDRYFDIAADVVQQLGYPAIFLSPYAGKSRYEAFPNILVADYCDLGYVLPLSLAIVHHGGIGTCARALSAGKPQVIVPRAYDQPDNACRLSRMGLAEFISFDELKASTLCASLGRLLSCSGTAERLIAYSRDVNSVDAIEHAADLMLSYAENQSLDELNRR